MDIAALVNPAPAVSQLPRRQSSMILSPTTPTTAAPLPLPTPTPPAKISERPKPRKRKRHDPKPIWAYREGEALDKALQEEIQRRESLRPQPQPAPRPQPQQQPSQSQPREPPDAIRNGGPPPSSSSAAASRELQGVERPVSDDANVYDEVSRRVCEFLWNAVVENSALRAAIAESPDTQVEIEARWGQIQERDTGRRINGIHETECVVKSSVAASTKFESTMSLEQHKRMNGYLNHQVQQSVNPGATRAPVHYKHVREIDMFYDLDQPSLAHLAPLTQQIILQSQSRQRIRVTRDAKSGDVLRKIIKHRIANLEISSPNTEWDYRIGVNLEINWPGDEQALKPCIEPGKTAETTERKKDRMSYSWLGAYQIDLTQVIQGSNKNHELELEVEGGKLLEFATLCQGKNEGSDRYERLVTGMINNLRVLSREVTPTSPSTG